MNKFKTTFFVWLLAFALLLPNVALLSTVHAEQDVHNSVYTAEELNDAAYRRAEKYAADLEPDSGLKQEELQEYPELPEEMRVIVQLKDPGDVTVVQGVGPMSYDSALNMQTEVLNAIAGLNIPFAQHGSFTAVMNGFSGTMRTKDIPAVANLPQVKSVTRAREYYRPEPLMHDSVNLIGANLVWNSKYKGEGMVVSVIDSGFTLDHVDMKVSDDTEVALDQATVEASGLPGFYYNRKFPYVFNYYDINHTVAESGYSHGTHVAGTVAANGVVRGVAPESQILAMRVFPRDTEITTTFSDLYIQALDDSVKLGADAANLSLGATAAFTDFEPDPMDLAIERAREIGMVVAIAAGNDRNLMYGYRENWGPNTAHKNNPDVGLISSPAISEGALTVASSEKYQKYSRVFVTTKVESTTVPGQFVVHRMEVKEIPGLPSMTDRFSSEESPYVYCGLGKPEDFTASNEPVTGKVALISRGEITFADKVINAKEAGAIGVILFNHEGEELLTNIGVDSTVEIPVIFAGKAIGEVLRDNPRKLFKMEGEANQASDPRMSVFSTWGATNNLDLKPEITAPGSDIYSLQPNNGYGYSSGTSMATPHVAGGTALVKQFLNGDDRFKNMTKVEIAALLKTVLMNTARVLKEQSEIGTEEVARSPRVQGAGLMDVDQATRFNAIAYDKQTGEGKVVLKELAEKNFNFTLELKNFSDKPIKYTVQTIVLADEIKDNDRYSELSRNITHTNNGDKEVVVASNGTAEVKIDVDFSADKIEKEQFVDGFVVLKGDDDVVLSVPFLAFYGDWTKPQILDNFISDTTDANTPGYDPTLPEGERYPGPDPHGPCYLGFSGLFYTQYPDPNFPFPVFKFHKNSRIEMNPGQEISAKTGKNNVWPHLSFLRSAEEMDIRILDRNENVVHEVVHYDWLTKVNRLYQGAPPALMMQGAAFKGNLVNGMLPEGLYYYELATKLNYEKEAVQSKKYDLLIDETAPVVSDFHYSDLTKLAQFKVKDPGAPELGVGVYEIVIASSLDPDEEGIKVKPNAAGTYSVDVSQLVQKAREKGNKELYIYAFDRLLNSVTVPVLFEEYPPEENILNITMRQPYFGQVIPENKLTVAADFYGWENLKKVNIYIDDELQVTVDPEYTDDLIVGTPWQPSYQGPGWKIDDVVIENVADGSHRLKIEGVSGSGETEFITHYITVNGSAPTLTVDVLDRHITSGRATLRIKAYENISGLILFINNSMVKNVQYDSPGIIEMDYVVDLNLGDNQFTLKAINNAKLETEVVVNIERQATDKTALQEEVELEDMVKQSHNYYNADENLKVDYETALKEAKDVLADDAASQPEIDDALAKLIMAREALNGQPTDKEALRQEVDKADQVRAGVRYQEASDELKLAYEQALQTANEVLADPDARQADVDKALDTLQQATAALNGEANKAALQTEVYQSDIIMKGDKYKYADSAKRKAYDEALAAAKAVLADTLATQAEVDKALDDLLNARANLNGVKPEINGWVKMANGDVYYYVAGKPVTGLIKIGKTQYLFNGKGVRQYGWHVIGDIEMYFNPENGGRWTGKRKIGATTYLLTDKGKVTGWHLLKGKKYYFDPKYGNGMLTGLRTVGKGTYFFIPKDSKPGADDRGSALTNGSVVINGVKYTFNNQGLLVP